MLPERRRETNIQALVLIVIIVVVATAWLDFAGIPVGPVVRGPILIASIGIE